MEPQIYKLYEELIKSNEPLEKRLELSFLATDFLVHSKTSIGTKHFLSVLQDQLVWRFQEISSHPKLKNYDRYLSMFLKYLLDKGIISPVKLGAQNDTYKELCYQSRKNQFYC